MRTATTFILCLSVSIIIYSQTGPLVGIHGFVYDQDVKPIAGASVIIQGTKTGTTTNAAGNFNIEASIGSILVVSSVSYETKKIKVTGTSVSIRLDLQVTPLDELVVSGNIVPVKRKADISSVSVLNNKDIESLPGFNLVNIMEGVVPGVTVSSIGTLLGRVGEYFNSRMQIRGADFKIYVDGIVYAAGSSYLALLNKDDIKKIEVVRGPSAATLYGSGAIGGVMLIYTKNGKPDKTFINLRTSVGFQQSDFVDKQFQQEHDLEVSQGIKKFSYALGGNYRTQDDYLPKGSLTIGGCYANFTYHTGRFKFAINNNYNVNKIINSRSPVFDTVTGIVANSFALYKDSAYFKAPYRMYSGKSSLVTNFQATHWWTHNLTVGYSENAYHYLTDISIYRDTTLIQYYTNHGNQLTAQDWTTKDKTPTFSYNNVIRIGEAPDEFRMELLSGFEYSHTNHNETIYNNELHYTMAGGFTYSPNKVTGPPNFVYKRESIGTFLQVSSVYQEKYFLVTGVRYEKTNVSTSVVNPRIGFTTNFEYGQLIIKPRINWGRSITPPPYYITHPNPSFGAVTFVANPDIKPKEQTGGEVATEVYGKQRKFRGEIVYYENIIKNDFATIRTVTNNGTALTVSYVNVGKYSYKGWEFAAEYQFNNFKITGNYSIINANYIDSFVGRKTFYEGDRVDYTPKYAAGASASYSFYKLFGKSDKLSLTLSMTSSGKMIAGDSYQYSIDFARWRQAGGSFPVYNFRETPAVTKFNLNIDWQFRPNLRFFIQAQNFTNNTTPDFDNSFPVPGASWMFGLDLSLGSPSTN